MNSSQFFLLLFFLTLAFLATILEAKKPKPPSVAVDNRTIDQIYEAALAEGGQLVVYANGNRAFQARTLSQTVPAFQRRFPGVNLTVVVDNTNTHASRANVQMALNSVVIDLIQLESVHDLYRWKEENDLHFYKPIVWDSIHPAFRDPDGAFTPISGTVFSMVVNTDLLPNETDWPKSFGDLVDDPKFYGKILAAYPVDVGSPDTTLFGYKQVIDKYGFDWMVKLMAQNVTIMRDSSLIPAALSSGQFSVGLFRPFPGNISNQRFILPENDKFVSYTVLTAIFNESPHKEAAKLYMNWQLEAGMQQTLPWTVREDVPPAAGFEHIWDYGAQSSYADFVDFYLDRAGAERTRNAIYLFVGEPKGPRPMDPNNQLGIRPH